MEKITRKFLLKDLPDLEKKTPIHFERYFIEGDDGNETRIQRKGDKFELETILNDSGLSRIIEKAYITEEEFNSLKEESSKAIIRDSYLFSKNPKISIKVYHENFDGLVRAEVDFKDEAEAKSFVPLEWFGEEITNSDLGRDKKLIELSKEEFLSLLPE